MPLFSLGSNGSGQLGLGHKDDVTKPCPVSLPDDALPFISIRAGGNHTILLTSSGQVYVTGENSDGRGSIWPPISQYTTFTPTRLKKVKLCAATWDASIFVHSIYYHAITVCGTGLKGELGLGPTDPTAESPMFPLSFPPMDTRVVDLAACMGHVVTVLSIGHVWGWGNGSQGQLGQPSEIVWQPRKINGLDFRATRAVCGKDFTVIFGSPEEGKFAIIGLEKRDRFHVRATAPQHVKGWVDVQATWGSIFVLYKDGTLSGWGRNDHGQLPPQNLPPIRSFAAGSEHVVAVTASGKAIAWGWGEHGNCGEPVDDQKDVKGRWNELVTNGEVIGVAAGCATTWIMTNESPS